MTCAVIDQGTPDAGPLVEPWNPVDDGYVVGVLPMLKHFAREAVQLEALLRAPYIRSSRGDT
jgi:hypothetical protein